MIEHLSQNICAQLDEVDKTFAKINSATRFSYLIPDGTYGFKVAGLFSFIRTDQAAVIQNYSNLCNKVVEIFEQVKKNYSSFSPEEFKIIKEKFAVLNKSMDQKGVQSFDDESLKFAQKNHKNDFYGTFIVKETCKKVSSLAVKAETKAPAPKKDMKADVCNTFIDAVAKAWNCLPLVVEVESSDSSGTAGQTAYEDTKNSMREGVFKQLAKDLLRISDVTVGDQSYTSKDFNEGAESLQKLLPSQFQDFFKGRSKEFEHFQILATQGTWAPTFTDLSLKAMSSDLQLLGGGLPVAAPLELINLSINEKGEMILQKTRRFSGNDMETGKALKFYEVRQNFNLTNLSDLIKTTTHEIYQGDQMLQSWIEV